MTRDIAIACTVGSFLLFAFGVLIGTSQFGGMALAWGLSAVCGLIAAGCGIRVVLLEHFPPKD